jgi:hypothetical protein
MASIVGMEYKYYQAIETGRRQQIRLVTLDKLANTFGLTGAGLLSEQLPHSVIPPIIGPIGRQRAKPKKRRRKRRMSTKSAKVQTTRTTPDMQPPAAPSPT